MEGVDPSGDSYQIFKNLYVNGKACATAPVTAEQKSFTVKMGFFGHYNEPELEVQVPLSAFNNGKCQLDLVFNPANRQWEQAKVGSTELKMNAPARIIDEKKEVSTLRAP